jgi:hypothetical protein
MAYEGMGDVMTDHGQMVLLNRAHLNDDDDVPDGHETGRWMNEHVGHSNDHSSRMWRVMSAVAMRAMRVTKLAREPQTLTDDASVITPQQRARMS